MTTTCRRCGTYCYGDCTSSEGRSTYAPRRQPVRVAAEPRIEIKGVVKTRAAWQARLVEDQARLGRITDASARAITEATIVELRAALS